MVRIKRKITPNGNHFGSGNRRRFITIHQTGNTSRGANAEMHSRYMNNGSPATWHYTVDDREAIQHLNHAISGWHAGDGRGDGNMHSIGVELCINSDGDYNKTIANAVELVKHLMKTENIPINNVVQHNRWSGKNCPRQLRQAKNGISWNTFINRIKGASVEKVDVVEPLTNRKTSEVVQMVIDGEFGNNPERRNRLRSMGYNPDEIQRLVNARLATGKAEQKTISDIAREVIDGKWGNYPERRDRLNRAGYDYDSVQNEVNRLANRSSATPKPSKPARKSLDAVAREVMDGKWGNNPERRNKLQKAGYNPDAVQDRVNVLVGNSGTSRKTNAQIAQEVIDGRWGNNPERERRLRNAGYNPNTIQNAVNAMVGGSAKKSVGTVAQEVIDGKWGNNPSRRRRLEDAGYNYNQIQREVNRRL